MPVFLDKLDFFKVTAADIAQIHLEGQRIRQEFGCYVMASWFDQKRKTTFYLIDAPDLDSVKKMHCNVYHSYPGQIIQVEEDMIESFLNNIVYPKSNLRNSNQSYFSLDLNFCAVMVLKINFSDPFLTKENVRRKRLFEDFKKFSQRLVRKNKGRIVKSAYDGYIYSFDSIARSLKAALEIQHELGIYIKINSKNTIKVSIGIDGGKPMNEHCLLFEETTNLAHRLSCIAGNNQIVVSSSVKEQFQLENFGTRFKNSNLKSLNYNDEQFLTRLMDIIEPNYMENLKIGDLCKFIGESRSQLYRKIIDVTSLPPIELINEIRLKKAQELINMQQGNNISQIALEVGFNSLSYFTKRFKKRFGHLPSAYMKGRCSHQIKN